jgi:hypothetical protein
MNKLEYDRHRLEKHYVYGFTKGHAHLISNYLSINAIYSEQLFSAAYR